MKIVRIEIKGVHCELVEKTAIAILYPEFEHCSTLAEAKAESEAQERIWRENQDYLRHCLEIGDYDAYSDAYKDMYGVRPHWVR